MTYVSVVIPIFNEEQILRKECEHLVQELSSMSDVCTASVILVENGSTDATASIAYDLAAHIKDVSVLSLPDADYGKAMREGMCAAKTPYIAVFNIDYWDTVFLKDALFKAVHMEADIIVGSKTHPAAHDKRSLMRRGMTRIYNRLLRRLFSYPGTDTHGLKMYRTAAILPVVQDCISVRGLFDTELMIRSHRAGLCITELPVTCEEKRPRGTWNFWMCSIRVMADTVSLYRALR